MGTALDRHSALTDLSRKSEGFGVPGSRCDGMDVLDVSAAVTHALEQVRCERRPQLVEAVTYRFRGHSMADPEEYRTKQEVEHWRGRDPIESFSKRLTDEGVFSHDEIEAFDQSARERVDAATEAAEQSPFPELDSLYDDIYVTGDQVGGWYSIDERAPEAHRGEKERSSGTVAHELAEAGARYATVGDSQTRRRESRREQSSSSEE
jgi:TPP-dependent pyruvate/acetoin dehydrogenase alpha subunit